MKKIYLIVLLLVNSLHSYAQDDTTQLKDIQVVVDACIGLRDAILHNDTDAATQSASLLRDCNVYFFEGIDCLDSIPTSLNGHLVFDAMFVDKLNKGENAYLYADEIEALRRHEYYQRGQTADGSIRTKTCFIMAGASTKYIFASKGHQELAIVAENGGLLTMKIHVTNRDGLDKRYDDTKYVKTGRPQRQASFDLPDNRRNIVELEVINCGTKDCSFVIISN